MDTKQVYLLIGNVDIFAVGESVLQPAQCWLVGGGPGLVGGHPPGRQQRVGRAGGGAGQEAVWGAGAGPGPSGGYYVDRIQGSNDLVVSAAIMAGFLHAADDQMRETINSELRWLYDNEVPSVPVQIPSKLCRLGSHVDLPANHSTTKK